MARTPEEINADIKRFLTALVAHAKGGHEERDEIFGMETVVTVPVTPALLEELKPLGITSLTRLQGYAVGSDLVSRMEGKTLILLADQFFEKCQNLGVDCSRVEKPAQAFEMNPDRLLRRIQERKRGDGPASLGSLN